MSEFGDLPAAQRRRSSIVESRVVDAVLDIVPTAESRMDEIAAKIRPILQVCSGLACCAHKHGIASADICQ